MSQCAAKLTIPHTDKVVVQCVRDTDHSTGDTEWHVAYAMTDQGTRVFLQWKDQPCLQCG
jgi:hypothetical protein